MKHFFIINPVSGDGKYQEDLVVKLQEIMEQNPDIDYHITTAISDATVYTNQKCTQYHDDILRFYACGGDGTLNEVINGIVDFDKSQIAIIPCGTGNDFADNFGNPKQFLDIDKIIHGKVKKIDIIKVNDKFSANVVNIGIDADVAFNMHKMKKIPFVEGRTAYYVSIISSVLKSIGVPLQITVDDKIVYNDKFLLMATGNGKSYGGGFLALPNAKIDDGFLDLCMIKNVSRFKIAKLIKEYKLGNHCGNKAFEDCMTMLKCKRINVKSHVALNVCIDGELLSSNEVNIEIIENAIDFVIPRVGE